MCTCKYMYMGMQCMSECAYINILCVCMHVWCGCVYIAYIVDCMHAVCVCLLACHNVSLMDSVYSTLDRCHQMWTHHSTPREGTFPASILQRPHTQHTSYTLLYSNHLAILYIIICHTYFVTQYVPLHQGLFLTLK